MKMKSLYLMNFVYILLSLYMFLIARKYIFVDETARSAVSTLAIGIIGSMNTFYINQDRLQKAFKHLLAIYTIGLISLTILFNMELPIYTYKDAIAKIESETGEEVGKGKEVKKTIGHYIIETNGGTYLFNVESGDFAKRQENAKER
ncbi:hypothetical protein AM499_06360 [Bacillus sp. FJAT-22090]|uniref:hypothetical protein n=1 Tax=Bacillus sp. FJAT-22090 TaxID=1581038 RepID=UPI0006B0551F|nr:hypothetical protein [Bacillus sp. FJAT-22090]ALC85476.1 hypothetical protein AM499_06360 [Bacillus sp. FJAT-22090]